MPIRIWNPAAYQGGSTTRRYFEGWYFKQVDGEGRVALAVIPGVSFSADGRTRHAFVQVISGDGATHYFSYPVEEFAYGPGPGFAMRIGENTFGEGGMQLRLQDGDFRVEGELRFGPWSPWPVTALSPGIMGWYRFVPAMETYHGVLSMDHEVSGTIDVNGRVVCFDGGRGYAEKDWGRSFPSSWIWAQSNGFDRPGVSVTVSVAKVPWMTGAFIGHIAGLLLDGTLFRFATYTGAKLVCVETRPNAAHLVLRDRRHELDLVIEGCETAVLKAPVLGAMEGRDAESLGGTIGVTLRGLRGGAPTVLFEGTGRQAGVEVMDDLGELGTGSCAGVDRGDAPGRAR